MLEHLFLIGNYFESQVLGIWKLGLGNKSSELVNMFAWEPNSKLLITNSSA